MIRRTAAVVVAAALTVAGSTAATPSAATPSGASATGAPHPFTVTDASLRWSVNEETNNSAFAPGTWNLLSAGRIGNPGAGGTSLNPASGGRTWSNGKPAGWTSRSGTVTIEDLRSDGTYTDASFDGTRQDAAGSSTSPPGSGVFAQTQVAVRGGTGTVDPAAGTATLSWSGSFTVLYYSGMTYFVVTDPSLRVTPTSSRLTATVSGYATSMADASQWRRLPDERVTLADFATVDLGGDRGFSATPRYSGVRYDAPADGTPQVRSEAGWGAFPSSLLAFLSKVGMAAYWYSSGGTTDGRKVAAPVTVSWDSTSPVPVTTPSQPASSAAQPSVSLAPPPPTAWPAPTPGPQRTPSASRPPRGQAVPPVVAASGPVAAPAATAGPAVVSAAVSTPFGALPPRTVLAAAELSPGTADRASSTTREWLLGTVLILLAAATVAAPSLHRHRNRRKARS